jgi:hypothetical protein
MITRFFQLSTRWLVSTCLVIYNTYAIMPRPAQILGVTITAALLLFTTWFPWLCAYWYSFSFVAYLCFPRYREAYRITLATFAERRSL